MNVSRLATTVASTVATVATTVTAAVAMSAACVATAHVADEIVIGASLPRT